MLPPSKMFLSSVKYIEGKGQVAVEFSNAKERTWLRYGFTPRAHFPATNAAERNELKDLFLAEGLKRLAVAPRETALEVSSQDFFTLQSAVEAAENFFGERHKVLPPEQQFLIEAGWNYFDCFKMGFEPKAFGSFGLPDCRLDFVSGTLADALQDLAGSKHRLALETNHKIAFSRFLKVPLADVQLGMVEAVAFAENVSFASNSPIPDFGGVAAGRGKLPVRVFEENFWAEGSGASAEPGVAIDFSGLISLVCSEPVNNLGFESMGCHCCTPASLEAKNILPSSKVRARFLKEGFYFASASPGWSEDFHNSNDFKASRIERKEEYCLGSYPVGPFSRNEEREILLADALALQKNSCAEIVSPAKLDWVCSARESVLSREINSLKQSIESIEGAATVERDSQLSSNGLVYYFAGSAEAVYSSSLSSVASMALRGLPHVLRHGFGGKFRVVLESVSGAIARDIEELASLAGSRTNASFGRVMVEPQFAHNLFRGLSSIYRAKKPFIRLELLENVGCQYSPF